MDELCHICIPFVCHHCCCASCGPMSHVPCEWVTSHMNASCRVETSHITYEYVMCRPMSHVPCALVMSRMNESCHVWTSHVTYQSHVSAAAATRAVTRSKIRLTLSLSLSFSQTHIHVHTQKINANMPIVGSSAPLWVSRVTSGYGVATVSWID